MTGPKTQRVRQMVSRARLSGLLAAYLAAEPPSASPHEQHMVLILERAEVEDLLDLLQAFVAQAQQDLAEEYE